MTLAFERYTSQAINIDRYIDSMENNREQFLKNVEQTEIAQTHFDYFSQEPLKFLIITEDWCSDSVQFIPVLVKLAQENENLEIKALRRDEHQDLAGNYLRKDGYQAIPVFVVFDGDGRELGALIERPEQASTEMAEETRRFQEANPDLEGIKRNINRMPEETQARVKANSRAWRKTQQNRFADHLLNELRQIIESEQKASAA